MLRAVLCHKQQTQSSYLEIWYRSAPCAATDAPLSTAHTRSDCVSGRRGERCRSKIETHGVWPMEEVVSLPLARHPVSVQHLAVGPLRQHPPTHTPVPHRALGTGPCSAQPWRESCAALPVADPCSCAGSFGLFWYGTFGITATHCSTAGVGICFGSGATLCKWRLAEGRTF
jgi:hypothetical protein